MNDDDAFGYWFSGFVDGEGCFDLSRKIDKRNRNWRPGWHVALHIQLRDDDREILYAIQKRLGGGISFERHTNPGGQRTGCRWSAQNLDMALKMVALFRRYPLRAKKQRDFTIWAQAVEYLVATKGSRKRNYAYLEALHAALKATRAYSEGAEIRPISIPMNPQAGLALAEGA